MVYSRVACSGWGRRTEKDRLDVFILIWEPIFKTKDRDDYISPIKISHLFIVPGLVEFIHMGLC